MERFPSHSRTQAPKPTLPSPHEPSRPLILFGGACLSALAGYVDVSLIQFIQIPVSHMTGAVAGLGIDLGATHMAHFGLLISAIFAFLIGAAVSGLILGRCPPGSGCRYGLILMLEGLLLGLAAASLLEGNLLGLAFAAMACGLQNAAASNYGGLSLKTTHITGMVTDIGVLFGHWLRHRHIDRRRLLLMASLVGGFFAGGAVAGVVCQHVGGFCLWGGAGGSTLGGFGYWLWRRRSRRLAPGLTPVAFRRASGPVGYTRGPFSPYPRLSDSPTVFGIFPERSLELFFHEEF